MTPRTVRTQSVRGVALKVAGTLLAVCLVRDAWLDRAAEQERTVHAEFEMDKKQQVAANHDGYAAQLQEMRATLPRLVQRLPSKFDVPAIEKALHDQATLASIQITSMRSGNERSREGFYAELPLDLVVQGPSAGFARFMADLIRDSPLRVVMAMKIEPTDSAAMLRAAMTVRYYRYIEADE